MNKEILGTPDCYGWHFFQKTKKSTPVVVFVNEDGECFAMNEDGESWSMDDTIGNWTIIDIE